MEKITGNFLTQPNKDFPLDCETLEYLQELTALAGVIGNIAGDKVILTGCRADASGTKREAGYVFVRTRRVPEGEVLPWEGGSTVTGMYVRQEDVSVTANNTDYPKAYTRRCLAPGIGGENYSWDDFTELYTLRELMAENERLKKQLGEMSGAPAGSVMMWAGQTLPEGYLLCDGQALAINDYPELYKAIGATFSNAVSASGVRYSTGAGQFRLPDLRGRFVVGQHDSDGDYTDKGAGGGMKKVSLSAEQLPHHTHMVKDYMMIPHGSGECSTGKWTVDGRECNVGYDSLDGNPKRSQTDNDKRGDIQWIEHESAATGEGTAHENRPPYYVLAYIIRTK